RGSRVTATAERPEAVRRAVVDESSRTEERTLEAVDAIAAAEDVGERGGPHDEPDDLGEGDGDDGEVVGSQPQRGDAHDDAEAHGVADADRDAPPHRDVEGLQRHAEAVRAAGHEARLPEV